MSRHLPAASTDLAERVRRLCLAMPGAVERTSHGAPAFFTGPKARQFLQLWAEGHHDHDFPHLWCAAPEGAQAECEAAGMSWYFRPPYVGHRGWLGVRLDADLDGAELAGLVEDAYRTVSEAAARS